MFSSPLRIVFIGMPQDSVEVLSAILRNGGFEVQFESIDGLPQLNAVNLSLCKIILADSLSRHPKLIEQVHALLVEKSLDIPVLVYSSQGDEAAIVAAMKAGAKDFISNNNPKRILSSVKRELVAAQQRVAARKQAKIDTLAQQIDAWTLQGLSVELLAHEICTHVAQVFDLRLAWIGGKQADGSVSVVAAAGCVDYLQQIQVRWDARSFAQCPVGAAIVNKHAVAMKVDAPAYESCRKMAEQHQLQSILALPMVAQNGVIGVLVMYSGLREAFDTVNVNRYSIFSNRLALNLMLAQEHQKFRLVNAAMSKATQAIFITQHDGKIIWFNQALSDISGYSEQEIMDSTPHMFNSGSYEESFWQTILQGKVWTGDVLNRRKDGSLYNVFQTISPLHNNQNEINYFLCVQQDVSEKKELERKIEYLAYHDMLTGLPNRTLFYDRVEQAITQAKRDQTEFSLLFIDLDGFKEINDNHGHAAGDLVLKTVAERLRACVREGDTVARLGGDEFMVLLRDIHPSSDLKNVTQKILEHVALPYELGAVQAQVTVSIGVSNYPSDGGVVEKLISCADDAMYIAKRSGKNRYVAWRSQQHLTETSDWQI